MKIIDNAQSYLLPKLKKKLGYDQEKAGKWQIPDSQSK